MGLLPPHQREFVTWVVFTIFQSFIFLLVTIACPLDQINDYGLGCHTLWGYKRTCSSTHYTYRTAQQPCSSTKRSFGAAAAFSILSILTTAVTLVLTILKLVRVSFPIVAIIATCAASTLFTLVVWACVAGTKVRKFCEADLGTYGGGFVLGLLAWIIQIVNLCTLLLTIF